VKKRIAIWIHGGVGGGFFSQGQPPIQNLVTALTEMYTIDVFSLHPPNADFLPEGFNIFFPTSNWRSSVIRWIDLIRIFRKQHSSRHYDLLYAFWGYPSGVVASMLGKLLGKPVVIHLQGGDAVAIKSIHYGVFSNSFRAKICRWAYRRSSLVIALTNYQLTCLRQYFAGGNVVVIPFGVNTESFTFQPQRFTSDRFRFLHVGNLTPVKGQYMLLKTFSVIAKSHPSTLTIVGGDFYNEQLKVWCEELGITTMVRFAGAVRHAELKKFYHDADVLLHTSLYEGQGLVFAEAAACGALIAGTPVGLLADMGPACGVIAPAEDANLLAEKIMATIREDKGNALRLAARRWIEKHDEKDTVRKISDRLDAILNQK
jgi:glycosyltransferase involved in cell wall biosynthesis